MKKILISMVVVVVSLNLWAEEVAAPAPTETAPGANPQQTIDNRQERQGKRIEEGVANGSLNEQEAKRLKKQQAKITKMEEKANADGTVSNHEMKKIKKAQNHASKMINHKKHNKKNK